MVGLPMNDLVPTVDRQYPSGAPTALNSRGWVTCVPTTVIANGVTQTHEPATRFV